MTRILRTALELLDGRDCSIQLLYGQNELRTVHTAGESGAEGARIPLGEGIAGRVAETREPVLVDGVLDPDGDPDRRPPPPTSSMSVPLIHRGSLLGVMNINATEERAYTEHDLRAFSLFGEQAATAITNAPLHEAQRLSASRTSYQALHDGLTGLANRTLFLDRLGLALSRRRSDQERIALLTVDLDDFKRINDSLGHEAGDRVLVKMAERLRNGTRAADTVARLGGDEFAILVEGVRDETEARKTATRILDAIRPPVQVGDHSVQLGASIGIILDSPGSETTREDLLRSADTALHSAKREGRGSIRVFDPTMHLEVLRQFELETELAAGLEAGDLEPYYQPIYALGSRRITALEVLARWHHPDRGLLAAGEFISVAEESGLLPELDRWLLEQACIAARHFPEEIQLHVNICPARLREPGIAEDVGSVLAESGLDGRRLSLELTESAILHDPETAATRLMALHDLGVRLALDDFGTGYSSLSHVRRFPVDTVKIDRTFVDTLGSETDGLNLVEAIVRFGQGLNLDIVAEGVETETQLEILESLGCGFAQGFFLARPAPLTRIREMFE